MDWIHDSLDIVIGYIVSWTYILVFLSYFQRVFGKSLGILLVYGTSWIVWFGVTYFMAA